MSKSTGHPGVYRYAEVFLLIASILLALLILEFFLRLSPLGDSMGWARNVPVAARVAEVKEKAPGEIRILGLGDSFSDYRDEDGKNYLRFLVRHAEDNGNTLSLVNLSQAGTGLQSYRYNFSNYAKALAPDIVTIGIYLGNDIECPLDPSSMQEKRRDESGVTGAIKRNSVLVNYLYRRGKLHVPCLRSGTYEKNLATLIEKHKAEEQAVNERLGRIDAEIIELSKSDLINPWSLATALVYPQYYSELYALKDRSKWMRNIDCFLETLADFAEEIKTTGAEPVFILIPDGIIVSKSYHDSFERLGFDVDENLHLESSVPLLEKVGGFLSSGGYKFIDLLPELRRHQRGLYIPLDIHFNTSGQELVGRFVFEKLVGFDLLSARRE